MQAERTQIPRVAFLLAGVAAGAFARLWASRPSAEVAALRRSVADLETELARRQSAQEVRIGAIEERLDDHDTRLATVPTTEQIVSAMQDILGRTMQNLDQRLSAQSESIELLKTTVTQTDALLERVVDSIESLRQEPSSADNTY